MMKKYAPMLIGLALLGSSPVFAAGTDGTAAAGATTAAAVKMSHGEVKKVDTAAGKLTIKHGPLENLGMDAMTMVFRVKDPAMLRQVAVGDQIDFVADEVNGALTVTQLQKGQ